MFGPVFDPFGQHQSSAFSNGAWDQASQPPPANLAAASNAQASYITFQAQAGIVTVQGTAAHDKVTVSNAANNQVRVSLVGRETRFFDRIDLMRVEFFGRAGNDEFRNSTTVNSRAFGDAGNDFLQGSGGDDEFRGGDGQDTLRGNGGRDLLLGGNGADIIQGGIGDDTIHGGDGNDNLQGDAGNDTLTGGAGLDQIHGGSGADQLFGGDGDDTLQGDTGNDQLSGLAGNDTLSGGVGSDTLNGGNGNDSLYGNKGADKLFGNAGNDVLHGGAHNDLLNGGHGDDQGFGGSGQDQLFLGAGNDIGHGDEGDDLIVGWLGHDVLYGGAGNDRIRGGAGEDQIHGDAGADLLAGEDGSDVINGGDGQDDLHGGDGVDSLDGGSGNDVLNGGAGNDWLFGGRGADQLFGEKGNDGLFGGVKETDILNGGDDEDRLLINGSDTVINLHHRDARIVFQHGSSKWNDKEIQILDEGLRKLHLSTRNAVFLQDGLTGADLTFVKVNSLPGGAAAQNVLTKRTRTVTNPATGQTTTTVTYSRVINVAEWDESDEQRNSFQSTLAIHEIAHNWDSVDEMQANLPGRASLWTAFMATGTWSDQRVNNNYVRSGDGEWWYHRDMQFAREYGRTNPFEDWASMWELYFSTDSIAAVSDPILKEKLIRIDNVVQRAAQS